VEGREMKKGVILFHPSAGAEPAFDVFFLKGCRPEIETGFLYQVPRCRYVVRFLREHPEYEYLGSEDLDYTESINAGIREWLERAKSEFEEIWAKD